MHVWKNANPFYTILPISLGVICILATVSLTIYHNGFLKDFMRKTRPAIPDASLTMEVQRLEREIKFKKINIESESSLLKMNDVLPKSPEESNRIKTLQTGKIEKWEAEIADLQIKLEEAKRLEQESIGKSKGSFEAEYNIDLLVYVICLGIISAFAAESTFIRVFPRKDGAIVNFERKSFLFFITAISISAFGFTLYLWYLSI